MIQVKKELTLKEKKRMMFYIGILALTAWIYDGLNLIYGDETSSIAIYKAEPLAKSQIHD